MESRADVEALDRDDELAGFRDQFLLPDDVIYLDGNSLGPLSKSAAERTQRVLALEWGEDLITSWNQHGWIDLPQRVGNKIARLIGGGDGNVVCADSTSINLFKLLAAALRLKSDRKVILTDTGNFPTDLYVAQGLRDLLGADHQLRLVEPEAVADAIDTDVAVVMLTQVDYRTGRKHDMASITKAAHASGAVVLWDLSHSAGALPVDLLGDGVDLAVGCTYKYLNGGPGAPAYLFVSPGLQDQIKPPLSGWMGHDQPFDFDHEYRPAAGIARNLCGTPAILSMSALDAALDVILAADIAAIRAKSQRLTGLFMDLVDQRCGDYGFACLTPKDPDARGSQVSMRHPNGYPVMAALIDGGVIGDFRTPDVLRFGFAPLFLRYVDVWDAVDRLHTVMAEKRWDQTAYHAKAVVT